MQRVAACTRVSSRRGPITVIEDAEDFNEKGASKTLSCRFKLSSTETTGKRVVGGDSSRSAWGDEGTLDSKRAYGPGFKCTLRS